MVVPRSQRSLAVSLALRAQGHPAPPRSRLSSRRALADEVSELIARELILSDLIPPGELLPSEKELTERYGVSRVTIRAGLRTLKEAGLIGVRQGIGATVLPRFDGARFALERLSPLEALMREAGCEPLVDEVEVEQVAADPETARLLALDADDVVASARRRVRIGTAPVAWLVDFVRRDALELERLYELQGAALDALLAHAHVAVDYSDCELSPVALPPSVAERLGVPGDTPAMLLDEVVHAVDGSPLARCQGWHLALPDDRRFVVRRRRRVGD